ncbi:PMP-22/EMP/MP20/Claudin tight junction [Popillia japonica]|uniref:PMP-22/EMP/MP20/Claudin tight junction n=1 Tax=Popillia japonica TaxID=7064 RepID=A0AAW1LST8_POPJA
MGADKNEYHKASKHLVNGAILTYIAGIFLIISFCSPYWVQSFHDTFSDFKHMGLWEYCFSNFRYPYYQFDKLFTGCHHVFSEEYYVIREWLLPPWLMAVQAFVTMSLLLSFSAQMIMALQLCRWPLNFILKYEWILSAIDFICCATTAVFLFFAVAVFGGSHARRDWLMYPNFNYLSWSYGMAVLSFFFHAFAAISLYREARLSYEVRKESWNLIRQMQSNEQHYPGYI